MYAFYMTLMDALQKEGLDGRDTFSIDVDIDGNVAVWKIDAKDKRANELFEGLKGNTRFFEDKWFIEKCVNQAAEKMDKKSEITDIDLLISELKMITLETEKPTIGDNDELAAPAVRFY